LRERLEGAMMRVESLETQLRGFETAKKRLRLRLTRAEREANDLRKVNETRMRENTRLRADAEQLEVLSRNKSLKCFINGSFCSTLFVSHKLKKYLLFGMQ
jgi:hypothetical protein